MWEKSVFNFAAAAAFAISAPAWTQPQPVTLKLSSAGPVQIYLHRNGFTPWVEDVNRAAEGVLKIDTYYGGTLASFPVTYDRVVDGVADIGFILASFGAGKFKLHEVGALPFEAKTELEASTALWNIYEKGVTAAEFDAVKPLALWVFSNQAVHSKEPIRNLADVKGKKLTAGNAVTARVVVSLGGSPVTFRPDELFQALSRGVADGSLINFTGMSSFKLHEVAKHHLDAPLGGDPAMLFISKKKYDGLPPRAKAVIDKYSYLALSQRIARVVEVEQARSMDMVKDRLVKLSPPEEERWKKAAASVASDWAKETPNGAKVLAAFRAEIKAFAAKAR